MVASPGCDDNRARPARDDPTVWSFEPGCCHCRWSETVDPIAPKVVVGTANQDGATIVDERATMDMNLEVVVIPVADVDRALRFYQGLGWRVDADFETGPEFRIVQLTPPGSRCSIHIGRGLTPAAAGSVQGTYLVVPDLEKARAELIGHGAEVSEVFHRVYDSGTPQEVAGPAPNGASYGSYATFSDPDGNGWLLQEVRERLPGR
ncbi:VOC family protein [Streptomyces sp. NPDC059389]|uniref:VOC family protein n=1 Tax=Streptomyces sp. NPDC059389 TaxID=3346818 RepID=UPI003674D2DC